MPPNPQVWDSGRAVVGQRRITDNDARRDEFLDLIGGDISEGSVVYSCHQEYLVTRHAKKEIVAKIGEMRNSRKLRGCATHIRLRLLAEVWRLTSANRQEIAILSTAGLVIGHRGGRSHILKAGYEGHRLLDSFFDNRIF